MLHTAHTSRDDLGRTIPELEERYIDVHSFAAIKPLLTAIAGAAMSLGRTLAALQYSLL